MSFVLRRLRERKKSEGKNEGGKKERKIVVLLEALLGVVVKGRERICHSHPLLSLYLALSHTHRHTHFAICSSLRNSKPKSPPKKCKMQRYVSTVYVCALWGSYIRLAGVWRGIAAELQPKYSIWPRSSLSLAGVCMRVCLCVCASQFCLFLSNKMTFGHCP